LQVVQSILDTAPEEETHGEELFQVIRLAIRKNNVGAPVNPSVFRLLLLHDPDVTYIHDEEGFFLLHCACFECSKAPVELVELLIDLNPHALLAPLQTDESRPLYDASYDGMLPLHLTCYKGCGYNNFAQATFQLVLSSCPEAAREVDSCGNLPLHSALQGYGIAPESVIMSLLECFPEGTKVENNDEMLPLQLFHFGSPRICY